MCGSASWRVSRRAHTFPYLTHNVTWMWYRRRQNAKGGLLEILEGKVHWCRHCGNQYGESLKNEKHTCHLMQQCQHWVYAQKTWTHCIRDTCTTTLTTALFTVVAKIWNQARCPPSDEWVKITRMEFTQWNIIQLCQRMKFYHLHPNGPKWRTSCWMKRARHKKTNIACTPTKLGAKI